MTYHITHRRAERFEENAQVSLMVDTVNEEGEDRDVSKGVQTAGVCVSETLSDGS